jgi:hypothetical protein
MFDFSPLSSHGTYSVSLICGSANVSVCGSFFSGDQSTPVTFVFSGAAVPTNITDFKTKFVNAVAGASGIQAAQVTSFSWAPTRRRVAGFQVNAQMIGTAAQTDPTMVANQVVTAATNGGLNTAFVGAGIPTLTSTIFNGKTTPAGAANTPTPTPIPAAGAATSASLMVIMSVVLAALLALFH